MRLPLLILTLILAAPLLRAQKMLYAEHGDNFLLVRAARGGRPMVQEKDKLVFAGGTKMALKDVDEYAPFFIAVRNVNVRSSALNVVDTGSLINNEFHFRAEFESPYPLDNVFLVLELDTQDAGKTTFLWEIGRLEPRTSKPVEVRVPMSQPIGDGKYHLHVFAGGPEIFHSKMPFDFVEGSLDRMVARRIKDVRDAAPKPFVGPAPEYPPKLRKARVSGQAVIHFTISPKGHVLDPTVKSATDPAFGEAALAAARQWRFLPKVAQGRPVAMPADMPFNFSP